MSKDWLKQFIDNYEGRSPEGNDLQNYTKPSARGGVYIPWAVIERMARMQDPDLELEVIKTDDGGLVHTDTFTLTTAMANKVTGGVDEIDSMVVSHSVEIFARFLDKTIVDYYPIQDTGTYAPVKAYDQNLVNKSIQRAKARALSRITGLGLKLYESKDLQFEDDGSTTKDPIPTAEIKKPEPPKTRRQNAVSTPTAKTSTPIPKDTPVQTVAYEGKAIDDEAFKQDEPVETEVSNYVPEAVAVQVRPESYALAELLMAHPDQTAVQRFLRLYNSSFQKSYGFTVTLTEASIDEVAEKFDKIPDPNKIIAAANAKGIK